MHFHNEFNAVDIDFGDEPYENGSHNSMEEEYSQLSFTDSDMHEFNKMEKEIYGQDLEDESHDITDDHTESLEFVKPIIPKRPSMGDAISIYDQLQSQYQGNFDNQVPSVNTNHKVNGIMRQPNRVHTSPMKSQGSSRNSGASADTVLSQEDEVEEPPIRLVVEKENDEEEADEDEDTAEEEIVGEVESASDDSRGSRTPTMQRRKTTKTQRVELQTQLAKETEKRREQEKYIEHLNRSIHQLQSRHALAEETIDQLRLGVLINVQNKTDGRPRQRPGTYTGSGMTVGNGHHRMRAARIRPSHNDAVNRRYSTIVSSADVPGLLDREGSQGSSMTGFPHRAKSVEIGLYEESLKSEPALSQHSDVIASMGDLSHNLFTPAATLEMQRLTETFQTRAEVIEQELQDLHFSLDGQSTNSSASPMLGARQRPRFILKERLRNIQSAYSNLQRDFKQSQAQFTADHKDAETQPFLDFKDQIEGQLFSLSMQMDNIGDKIKEDVEMADYIDVEAEGRELVDRMEDLEMQYDSLVSRYQDLRQHQQHPSQSQGGGGEELVELVAQLEQLVQAAAGRSRTIPTDQRQLELILDDSDQFRPVHRDNTDDEYGDNPDDPIFSVNSFTRVQRRRRGVPKHGSPQSGGKSDDSDKRLGHLGRLSPIKSSRSVVDMRPSSEELLAPANSGSHPQSVVSSSSMWHGATSGDTLLLDENGIFREPPVSAHEDRYARDSPSTPHSAMNGHVPLRYQQNPNTADSRRSLYSQPRSQQPSSPHRSIEDIEAQFQPTQRRQRYTPSASSRPQSMYNLDDDIRVLDHELALAELEDQHKTQPQQHMAYSTPQRPLRLASGGSAGSSRHTRSLLGTSPSNSNISYHSKPGATGSHASCHRSSGCADRGDSRNAASGKPAGSIGHFHHRRQQQQYPIREQVSVSPPDSSSGSQLSLGEHSDIYQYPPYVEASQVSTGIGNRSRFIRKKGTNYQDKWCQTPVKRRHRNDHGYSGYVNGDYDQEPEDPYQDYVDYWDGDKFHPAREMLPGKSILRRSNTIDPNQYGRRGGSQNDSMRRRRGPHPLPTGPPPRPCSMYSINSPMVPNRQSWNPNMESAAMREYAAIGPHRYFVREYGNYDQRQSAVPSGSYENIYDNLDEECEDDDYTNYKKYVDEQRMCRYLDEAIKTARSMKQYTRHINDVCGSQRQLIADGPPPLPPPHHHRYMEQPVPPQRRQSSQYFRHLQT